MRSERVARSASARRRLPRRRVPALTTKEVSLRSSRPPVLARRSYEPIPLKTAKQAVATDPLSRNREVSRTLDWPISCRIERYRVLAFIARIEPDPTGALRRTRCSLVHRFGCLRTLGLEITAIGVSPFDQRASSAFTPLWTCRRQVNHVAVSFSTIGRCSSVWSQGPVMCPAMSGDRPI